MRNVAEQISYLFEEKAKIEKKIKALDEMCNARPRRYGLKVYLAIPGPPDSDGYYTVPDSAYIPKEARGMKVPDKEIYYYEAYPPIPEGNEFHPIIEFHSVFL